MSKGYTSASPLATHRFVHGTMPRAASLELIRTMLHGMHGIGGIKVRLVADGIVIDGSGGFNGTAYTPAGKLYEELTDDEKPWLKYDLSTGAITEEIGPPSDPWGANEIWRKKSDFSGSIYF